MGAGRSAVVRRREIDRVPRGPRIAAGVASVGNRQRRAAANQNLQQLSFREEPYPAAIGREERARRIVGAGDWLGLVAVECAQVQLDAALGSAGKDDAAAVG